MATELMQVSRILVVDDEADMLKICRHVLLSKLTSAKASPRVETANSGHEARRYLLRFQFDLIIIDVKMPGVSGLELMHFALEHSQGGLVVLITAYPNYGDAVEAIKQGAFDYITKPFTAGELVDIAQRALAEKRRQESEKLLPAGVPGDRPIDRLLGNSTKLEELRRLIIRVAALQENVQLLGETGTGKGLVARIIHDSGPISSRPFVTLDCGAIPFELMESELFGHERGSFTGADRLRKGLLELAAEGTLFLDEISELPIMLQSRLLRALQEREFRRIGGAKVHQFRARIIAASNRDLKQQISDGLFREDLFYRLNVIPLVLPTLRERPEDIEILAEKFLKNFLGQNPSWKVRTMEAKALRALTRYDWPGNVRELENVIRRTAALCDGRIIKCEDLPREILDACQTQTSRTEFFDARDQWLSQLEERYFRELIQQTAGNVMEATRISGVPRPTMYRYLRKYDLDPAQYRPS